MMKRQLVLLAIATMLLSACETVHKTSTTADITTQVKGSTTLADLNVKDRITYTMTPSKAVRRGGEANVKSVAQSEALTKVGGNADLLLEPQYTIERRRNLLGSKITSITVSGRPAFYTNFRPLPDSLMFKVQYPGNSDMKLVAETAVKAKQQKGSEAKENEEAKPKPKIKHMRTPGNLRVYFEFLGGSYGWTGANHPKSPYRRLHMEDSGAAHAFLTLNYNLNSHISAGVGAGVNYFGGHETMSVPVYANARYSFSPKAKSAFVEARLGGNIMCEVGDWADNFTSGMYLGLGLGYSWRYFEITARYSFTTSDYSSERLLKEDKIDKLSANSHQLGLSLGVIF